MTEPSRAAASSRLLQKPGAGYPVASSPSSSSPTPQQTDPSPTKGAWNPPEASPALRNSGTACDTRVADTLGPSPDEGIVDLHESESQRDPPPLTSRGENSRSRERSVCIDAADQTDEWDKKHPFSHQAIRRRLRCRAQLSQQQTCGPERPPEPPAASLPRRLSGSPRAVQQDEPVPQGSASCEERQTSPGDTTCGKTATEMSRATPLGVEASHLVSPNRPAVPSPRSENSTHRESMPRRVSASKGDRDDEAMPPRVKPKAGGRRAAVCHGNRFSIDALGINDNDDEAEGVQQSDKDDDIRPPPRKRRRVSSTQYGSSPPRCGGRGGLQPFSG
ncbi:hypothetical protein B0H63DRAFT_299090 [Podospora didyma]|uniref:Uncharacterized protein n=1 Tax=Podospora didyma TaxID=330526 RepID=A0AAE0KAD5_9PEZI|nr:hypothetical protein B0H63DRAFT_299090 [Podospora didyma]